MYERKAWEKYDEMLQNSYYKGEINLDICNHSTVKTMGSSLCCIFS